MSNLKNVCMAVSSVATGAPIVLAPCDGSVKQNFSLQADGRLITKAKPDLCVTTDQTNKREGRGGTPVHVMRPLSLQPCSDANKRYQVWAIQTL